MINDIKIGDKYLCIKERNHYKSGKEKKVYIVGKTYEILSINTNNNNYYTEILISNECNNDRYFFTPKDDYHHYYFYEYFILDIKNQRRNKLKNIYESNL